MEPDTFWQSFASVEKKYVPISRTERIKKRRKMTRGLDPTINYKDHIRFLLCLNPSFFFSYDVKNQPIYKVIGVGAEEKIYFYVIPPLREPEDEPNFALFLDFLKLVRQQQDQSKIWVRNEVFDEKNISLMQKSKKWSHVSLLSFFGQPIKEDHYEKLRSLLDQENIPSFIQETLLVDS